MISPSNLSVRCYSILVWPRSWCNLRWAHCHPKRGSMWRRFVDVSIHLLGFELWHVCKLTHHPSTTDSQLKGRNRWPVRQNHLDSWILYRKLNEESCASLAVTVCVYEKSGEWDGNIRKFVWFVFTCTYHVACVLTPFVIMEACGWGI